MHLINEQTNIKYNHCLSLTWYTSISFNLKLYDPARYDCALSVAYVIPGGNS